jgi:hypothetical protein
MATFDLVIEVNHVMLHLAFFNLRKLLFVL